MGGVVDAGAAGRAIFVTRVDRIVVDLSERSMYIVVISCSARNDGEVRWTGVWRQKSFHGWADGTWPRTSLRTVAGVERNIFK